MQGIELSSFGSRAAGRISGNLALGTTVHHTIYVASRSLLIPLLPMLAYLVDTGITLHHYILLAMSALFSTFILSIFILIRFNFFQIFFQTVFKKYLVATLPIAILKSMFTVSDKKEPPMKCLEFSGKLISRKKVLFSFVAYFFLVNPFFIAFLLAILFPQYQLTLSQSTSFFHGFGAILLAFYLDPMLSKSIDNSNDEHSWLINSYSILFGRILSYIFSFSVFLALYLFL
jgi:hypothetical protein